MDNPLSHLHHLIVETHDENELRTLCFTLAVPYDALPGQGTAAVARELILYLGRRRRFDALLTVLCRERPGLFDGVAVDGLHEGLLAWEDATEQAQQRANASKILWLAKSRAVPLSRAEANPERVNQLRARLEDNSSFHFKKVW